MPPLIIAATVVFVAVCVGTDLHARRIPNVCSVAGLVAGLTLNGWYAGGPGVGASAAGCLVAIALLLGPFAVGGIGGGDLKMMGALGALLGPRLAVAGLVVGMIFGGMVMAAHLARRGELVARTSRIVTMVHAAAVTGSIEPLRVSADDPGTIALPYSIPLGLGTLAVLGFASVGGPA